MKKILKVFLIALMLIELCGCHGKHVEQSTSFVVPEEFDTTRNFNITFWAKNDSNKTQVEVYRKAVEDIEKIYPNIKVTIKLFTDYTRIYNDVITNISTNTTPNVCISYPDHIATYLIGADTMVDLDALMDDSKYGLGGSEIKFDAPTKQEIVPEFLQECLINDKHYALPYMRSTEALYINKDLVEKLGYEIPDVVTWDYIWEVSDKAVEKDEDGNFILNGQKTLIPFIYKSTDNMLISMLKQLDANYSNDDGEVLVFNDETRKILFDVGEHSKNGAFSTFKISSYPGNYLNAGQCLFAIDSTAGATWMGSEAPLMDIPEEDVVKFETVVRPIPQYDVNNMKMISQGPSVCIFNKEDPQEVLASWLFMQFLLTDDVQCGYAQTEGYIPVTSKTLNSDAYKDYLSRAGEDNNLYYKTKIEASELLIENTANTFVTPIFNGSTSLRNGAGQLIEETCKGARRKKEINDAFFDELFVNITSLYRLDQTGAINGKIELGPLPKQSKILIVSIISSWVIIACYFVYLKTKNRS